MTSPNASRGKAAPAAAAAEGKKKGEKGGMKATGALGKKGKGKGKKLEAQQQQTAQQKAEKTTVSAATAQSSLIPERAAAPKESLVKDFTAASVSPAEVTAVSPVMKAAASPVAISDVAPLTFPPSPLDVCAASAPAAPPTAAPASTIPAIPPSPESRVAAAISAVAEASAAAARQNIQQQQQQQQEKEEEGFEIYHKALTSQMTFDEKGNPILVPLKPPTPALPEQQVTTSAPSTTGVAITTEEAEGQFEAVPPPAGSCAGLCPPYGSLPETMSVKEHMGVAAQTGGKIVRSERILSLYSLPSMVGISYPKSKDMSCPQTLLHYLPPSPFVNRKGTIGVDILAVEADFTADEMFHSIPQYVELSTNAQPELQIKRAQTRSRSILNPISLELF